MLEKAQPQLVYACYGMNDGIYYPLGDERFQAFKNGMKRCGPHGARVRPTR